jgi:protein CWC15
MSTSGRPTYHSAQGKQVYSGIRTNMRSAKDQSGQNTLKFRKVGQATAGELRSHDFKTELLVKEQAHLTGVDAVKNNNLLMIGNASANKSVKSAPSDSLVLIEYTAEDREKISKKYDDDDVVKSDSDNDASSSDSNDDDDDDDDDEEELQAELERIKAERVQAQLRKEQEQQDLEEQANRESALKGNPLMNLSGGDTSSKMKRKWNDDVVFRNQTKDETEHKKRFINDTIRNDFHRMFLKKYVR